MKNDSICRNRLDTSFLCESHLNYDTLLAIKKFDGSRALYFAGNNLHQIAFDKHIVKIGHSESLIHFLQEELNNQRKQYDLLLSQIKKQGISYDNSIETDQ